MFIKCPIEYIIGIPCPGCNMTTALYYLLIKHNLKLALFYHPLVIVCVIYFLILLFSVIKYKKLDNKISKVITWIGVILLIIVYVYRMCTVFPNYPMVINKDGLLIKLLNL